MWYYIYKNFVVVLGGTMKDIKETILYKEKHNYNFEILTTGLQEKDSSLHNSYIKTNYVFEYIVEGEGTIKIDKKTYKVKRGDLILLPTNKIIDFSADKCNPFSYWWVDFWGTNASYILTQIGFNEKNYKIHYNDDTVAELMKKTHEAQIDNTLAGSLSALSHFFSLLSYLVSKNTTNTLKGSFIDAYLSKALWYIHSNFNGSMKVADIAEHINLSEFYLTSIFTKNIGMSPIDYLIAYRIQQAQNMLINRDTPITLVATSCGFNSTSYFTVQFKRIVGMTPREYRKLHGSTPPPHKTQKR